MLKNKSTKSSKSTNKLVDKTVISLSDICQDKKLYKKTYVELGEESRLFNFNDIKKFVSRFSIIGGSVIAGNCFHTTIKTRIVSYYIYKNHPRTLEKILAKIDKSYTHTKEAIYFKKETACKILLIKAKSIADIVFSFNSGPDQIAYDGFYFYFSAAALLACHTENIIANPSSAKSPNYALSLNEYITSGFFVLFPHGNFDLTNNKDKLKIEELFTPYFAYLGDDFIAIKHNNTRNVLSIEDIFCTKDIPFVGDNCSNYLFIRELLYGDGDFIFIDGKISPMPEINSSILLLMGILHNDSVIYNKNYVYRKLKEQRNKIKKAYNSYHVSYIWQEEFNDFSIPKHEWYGQYYTPIWEIPTSLTSQGTEKINQEVEYLVYNILIKYFPNDIVSHIIAFANVGHMATKPSLAFHEGKISLIKPFWHDYNRIKIEDDHTKNIKTVHLTSSSMSTDLEDSESTDLKEVVDSADSEDFKDTLPFKKKVNILMKLLESDDEEEGKKKNTSSESTD